MTDWRQQREEIVTMKMDKMIILQLKKKRTNCGAKWNGKSEIYGLKTKNINVWIVGIAPQKRREIMGSNKTWKYLLSKID